MNIHIIRNISFVKTIAFNLRYFGTNFWKLPVYIGKNVLLEKIDGDIRMGGKIQR